MRRPSLHVPQPCSEDWSQMSPAAAGRHCAACQKTVLDFTQKTDTEILALLAGAMSGQTCGRFRAEQLDRPLQPLAVKAPTRWRRWLAAALTMWGLREAGSDPAQAQPPIKPPQATAPLPVHVAKGLIARSANETQPREWVLRGQVLDSVTHEAIPGVDVSVAGTPLGTVTNAEGAFILTLPIGRREGIISFSRNSHLEKQVSVKAGTHQNLQVVLERAPIRIGAAVTMAHASSFPYAWPSPSRLRRLYYWTKHQLTYPFRHD